MSIKLENGLLHRVLYPYGANVHPPNPFFSFIEEAIVFRSQPEGLPFLPSDVGDVGIWPPFLISKIEGEGRLFRAVTRLPVL